MTKQEKQQICDELKRRGFICDKSDDTKLENTPVFQRRFVKDDPYEVILVNFPETFHNSKMQNNIENIVNEIIKEYNENKITVFEINDCGFITLRDRIKK